MLPSHDSAREPVISMRRLGIRRKPISVEAETTNCDRPLKRFNKNVNSKFVRMPTEIIRMK